MTDLTKDQLMLLFDMLDQNVRGRICFNEFYMVACILLCHEVCTLRVLESVQGHLHHPTPLEREPAHWS